MAAFPILLSLYWIFHPSHRDDPRKCLLNYHHALQNENKEITFFQVAVVRSENFQDYVSTWGKMLLIFQLPDQLPMEGEDGNVGPSEGGIGYARRFIQQMAFALNLEYVFVIDDNVAVMSEELLSPGEPATCNDAVVRNDNGVMQMEPCSFWRPLNYLQRIVRGEDEPPDARKQYEAHPLTEEFRLQNFPLYTYTGPAKLFGNKEHESYGVLGLLRSVPNAVRPFAKTQVYAAVLLNVKSTVEKRVLYRPWPCWEDLRFNDDCDKEGLWVVKCNRFRFHKVQYSDWINRLVPPIFQWTEDTKVEKPLLGSEQPIDFEENVILKHILGLFDVEGHDKCFEGEIGYSDSRNSNSDDSPRKLLEQLRMNKPVDLSSARSVPVLVLAYSLLKPAHEDFSMLEKLYCLAEEKVVFVLSLKEAVDEWRNNVTLDYLQKRGIPKTEAMRNRKAKFAIFSAADPSQYRLRWIVVEASFKGEGMRTLDANSFRGVTDARKYGLPSEASVSETRGSKRSVEGIIKERKESKRQTRPWREKDIEKMVSDPNTSANQLESKQHTGILVPPSTPRSCKRVTPSSKPVRSKNRKITDFFQTSASRNTVSLKMKVTAVTTSLTNSAEAEGKESRSAVHLGQSSTRLTPEDSTYTGGVSEVTRSIVELWREKMKLKGHEDINPGKVKAKLENFKTQILEKRDTAGFSALTKACSLPSMSPRIVSYLLNTKSVDVNCRLPDNFETGDGVAANLVPSMSALSVALQQGNVNCVSTFMNRRDSIKFESRDKNGNTALHYCVSSPDAFEKLWPYYKGMNWRDMKNDEGKNPCDDAKEKYKKVTKKQTREALEFAINQMDPGWLKN